jgi:LDH2 family malate/lactate/ureidoglycolate dehydrogenase
VTTVSFEKLQAFIHAAMVRIGLSERDAAVVAALMAQADLQGSDGHGVSRLPQYARRIKAGGFNVKPEIRVVRERASTALVNGDNGMGHLVMSEPPRSQSRRRAPPALAGSTRSTPTMPARPRSMRGCRSPTT